MKKILRLTTTLMLLIFLGGNAWGQATLPVNAPSLDPIPTGFTNSGTGTYSGGSRKFDTQGDWFQLYFNSVPGELTFELGVNNFFPGTIPSTATFSVEESLDGNTWNNVGSYSNVPGGVKTINTLNSTSRYIRWVYSIKPSGTNIALKNVTLAAGSSGPTISVLPSTLTDFTYVEGSGPSAEQNFTVEGSNLTANISIAATTNYEISKTSGSGFATPLIFTQTGGVVAEQTIYVRLKAGLGVGDYDNEVITAASTGATDKTVTCSGSVTAPITSGDIVISQVYGGGGNTGAPYKKDFIELFNRSAATVNIDGWSVQYASSAGTSWSVANLTNTTLAPGQYYLIQLNGESAGNGIDLPTPDITGTINMSGTAGKVALVNSTTALTGSCPTDPNIIDFVGFGSANCYEGAGPTPAPSNTTSVIRADAGCTDDNDNSTDFTAETPAPRNTSTTLNPCGSAPTPEPTNHVTDFIADDAIPAFSALDVVWTDAIGATIPDGYVIKASDVSYAAIDAPVDGTPETPGTLIKVVASGVEEANFTGLDENTTYYFKIWPFTNSGAAIDYKTDGTVPQVEATTDEAPLMTVVNFDDDAKWTAGSAGIGSYASDHTYIDGVFSSTGGPALRNTTLDQDGFPGALGTYSWRLNNIAAEWTVTISSGGIKDFSLDIRRWDGTPSPDYNLDWSIDNGGSWTTVATIDNTSLNNSSDWKTFSGTINSGVDNILVRLNSTGTTERIMVDNFSWSPFSTNPATSIYTNTGTWTNASNWSNGLPGGTTDVTIDGNITINVVAECNDMTVSPTGAVTVGAGQGLIINGNLLIESSATGTGSFIGAIADYDITGTQTVKRYISGAAEAWHLLSSPVATQSIFGDFTPSGTYGDGTGYDFYAWDEPTETWLNQKVGANNITAFTPAHGYLVSYQASNPTKTFTGTLNEGIYYPTLTVSGTQSYQHSNLLGNPYPSSIDWKSVSGLDKSDLVADGGGHNMYIWNEASVNYGVYNDANGGDAGTNGTSRYIAPMQGFFVIAANAGDFGFDNDARVHSTQAWLKSGNDNSFRLSVTAPANTGKDEILLDFGHEASQGGADKWYSMSATAPALYATTVERDYSIRFLTSIADNPLVHVAFKAGIDGEYSIQADFNTAELPSVKLIDHLTGIVHDLISNPTYNFAAATGDDPNRFELKFGAVGIDDNVALEQTSIYSHGQSVFVSSAKSTQAVISIYNITGQQVYANTMVIDGQKQIALNTPTGWYIVKVTTAAGVATQKVFIKSN